MRFGLDPDGQKKAQEEVTRLVKELRGVKELGQTLLLPEWRGGVPPGVEAAGAAGRDEVARLFKEALTKALDGDATRQSAAATLFAEMTAADPQPWRGPGGDPFVTEVLSSQTEKIAALANSTDAAVREAVARALGRTQLDPQKVVEALATLLGDEKLAVKQAAAEALKRQARGADPRPGELGPRPRAPEMTLAFCKAIVPAAAKGLGDEDVSRDCAEAIKQAAGGVNAALGSLQQQLAPMQLPVPPMPVKPGFGGGAPPDGPPLEPWRMFRPAANALGDGVAPLLPLLKNENAERRVQGCQALGAIAATRARMLRVAGDGATLAKALGGKEDPLLVGLKGAVPELAACAEHKNVEVRLEALYVLEDLGPDAAPAAGTVAKTVKDEDPFVRWAAARVLGKMAPNAANVAVAALATLVADDNGDVRITGLAALERYKREALGAVKEVSQAVKARDEQTRLWAVRVLAAISPKGGTQTSDALTEALSPRESSVAVRRAAVAALAQFGKSNEKVAATLRTALADSDSEVRRTAGEALLAEE
jgi:HEAT repeat protein